MSSHKYLLTKKEAADALSVSLRTVENLIAARRLNTKHIGRRVLILASSLEEFVVDGSQRGTKGKPPEQ